MNRLYLTAGALLLATASYAASSFPIEFTENFKTYSDAGYELPDTWPTYGTDATPVSTLQGFYEHDGKTLHYVLMQVGRTYLPMACTNFTDHSAADAWLITPEIAVSTDLAELSWTVGVISLQGTLGTGNNTYKILVSPTGGTAKEDFTDTIYDGYAKGSSATDLKTSNLVCRLNGYKDKKVRIAFVATGCDAGLIGFTNLAIGNYAISVDNKTPDYLYKGETGLFAVNVGLKAPTDCPGVDLTLQIPGKEDVTISYTKPFGRETGNVLIYQLCEFVDNTVVAEDSAIPYTITITPQFEGAIPSVIDGTIAVPQTSYLNNVVVEEATATGCGFCPSGTATMEYLLATYPGTETVGKAIPIAVHGYMNYTDPMSEGVYDTYTTPLMDSNGTTSLPQVRFNRATISKSPWQIEFFTPLIEAKAINEAKITEVVLPANAKAGDQVDVTFDVKCGYDSSSDHLNAAVVLIENDVRGNESGYNQENYFSNSTENDLAYTYGSWIVPYLKEYIGAGSSIRFDKMVYNHVARGIYPSFDGTLISGDFKVDQALPFTISFEMPDNVLNVANTEAIVMIINAKGEIVASDIMPASSFTTGVEETLQQGGHIEISRAGNQIDIVVDQEAVAEVYTLDGVRAARATLAVGANRLAVANGPVIVKVWNSTAAKTVKLL